MNYNDNITKNFKWYEFFKSYTATRYNIKNYTDDPYILNNIKNLAENILQPLRDEFGPIRITSGYRSKQLNLKVNGSSASYHCKGMAVDIEPYDDKIPLIDILEFIHLELDYSELIAEFFPDGWVHVAYDENWFELKLKDDKHHYSKVSLEYIKSLYK
jgi:zinc D-Ala-D-Ala carboxypeptidase